jgi:hypothetical protein
VISVKFRLRAALAFMLLSLVAVSVAQESLGIAYKYSRLFNPGWFILPAGINNHNVIVGSYSDLNSDPTPQGFLYQKGQFTTLDYPRGGLHQCVWDQ